MTAREGLALAGWLILSFSAAAIGGIASAGAGSFYQELSRPEWAPPSAVFGPVWSVLYFLMGAAAWLVWRERGISGAALALGLFVVQLIANASWSWIFFAWQMGALAFGEVMLLWCLVLATLLSFWRVRPLAGALLLPYLLWVSYAAALTYSIWQRNPSMLA